jgi:hypothetical protein
VGDAALDDGFDLRQRPPEAGAGQAMQEGSEVRRLSGFEAAGQEGAVRCLQACRDRPVR